MSRSGYIDDIEDQLELGRWRARVASATRGKRGQKLLRDMLAALDAMPEKRLITDDLEISATADEKRAQTWVKLFNDPAAAERYHETNKRPAEYREGDVCALGALGRMRGMDMTDLNPENPDTIASAFDIAAPLAQEIVYMNDECGGHETPEERWRRMRDWIAGQIAKPVSQPQA